MSSSHSPAFKRVPAVDKCFSVLHLLAGARNPLVSVTFPGNWVSARSTVFNLVHTLTDLCVLEQRADGKFGFGTQLYVSGEGCRFPG